MRSPLNIVMTRKNLDQVKDFLLKSKTHVVLHREHGEIKIFQHGMTWGKSIEKAMRFQFSWQAERYLKENKIKINACTGVKEIKLFKNKTEKIPSTYTDGKAVVKEVMNIGGRDRCYPYDTQEKSYFPDFETAKSWYYHSLSPSFNDEFEEVLEDHDFAVVCDHVNW